MLHTGTMFAVIVYFWRGWRRDYFAAAGEDIESLAGRTGRTAAAIYKMLQRVRQALQLCVENHANPEVA